MPTMSVSLRSIPDTEAALGWTEGHTITVDRPAGKAGGMGLGFNGGQLLALAIGGCLCNDLRYVAHARGVRLTSLSVEVTLSFEGSPLLATGADVDVKIEAEDPAADTAALVAQAVAGSTVSNSIARGVPVRVDLA